MGCSSAETVSVPLRVVTSTGTISRVKAPLSVAALARASEDIAKASMSARVNW